MALLHNLHVIITHVIKLYLKLTFLHKLYFTVKLNTKVKISTYHTYRFTYFVKFRLGRHSIKYAGEFPFSTVPTPTWRKAKHRLLYTACQPTADFLKFCTDNLISIPFPTLSSKLNKLQTTPLLILCTTSRGPLLPATLRVTAQPQKAPIIFAMSVRLSVRMYQRGSHRTDFHEI
jgi:hypothetical protein